MNPKWDSILVGVKQLVKYSTFKSLISNKHGVFPISFHVYYFLGNLLQILFFMHIIRKNLMLIRYFKVTLVKIT